MASAWGKSWGAAWGNSWGAIGVTPAPEPPPTGGHAYGVFPTPRRRRVEEDEALLLLLL